MKSVIALIISVIGFSARAEGLICKNVKSDVFEETVVLKISNGIFEVSHFGHSRNTFKASYVKTEGQETRYGSIVTLEKINDESTWKDMPETLKLKYFVTDQELLVLEGLSSLGDDASSSTVMNCTH